MRDREGIKQGEVTGAGLLLVTCWGHIKGSPVWLSRWCVVDTTLFIHCCRYHITSGGGGGGGGEGEDDLPWQGVPYRLRVSYIPCVIYVQWYTLHSPYIMMVTVLLEVSDTVCSSPSVFQRSR